MNARLGLLLALLASAVTPASAHRLDEYLQATFLSLGKTSVTADMYLTPGVAVLPAVLALIDTDADGTLSPAEQRAYAERVLRDLSVTANGTRLAPRLISVEFPRREDLTEGRGDIHLVFKIELQAGLAVRSLRIENHHQPEISACQVNCLVPAGPELRIAAEQRNFTQTDYRVDYTEATLRQAASASAR